VQFSCAECGCVVEFGVRQSVCPDARCCCADLPACDWATMQERHVEVPPRSN
jgi:hypothetical protein